MTNVNWHMATRTLAARGYETNMFDRPVFSENAAIAWNGNDSDFAALDDVCAHVTIVAGRCLKSSDGARTIVTARIARLEHIGVGQVLDPIPNGNSTPLQVRVVGIVVPIQPHGDFWSPWPYLLTDSRGFGTPRIDAFFVTHDFLDRHERDVEQFVSANLDLRVKTVGLDNLESLRTKITRLQSYAARMIAPSQTSVPLARSDLPAIIGSIFAETSDARALVVVPSSELLLLAVTLLYATVAVTARASARELALAKLRGRTTGSLLMQLFIQPAALVLSASPIAAALSWVVIEANARRIFGVGTPVEFPATALAAIAFATVATALAAIVAAQRALSVPVSALLTDTDSPPFRSTRMIVFDVAALMSGAVGIIALTSGSGSPSGTVNPVVAVAPVLVGAAGSVIVLRAIPAIGRRVVRWTNESQLIATYIAVRQIVRRPGNNRFVVMVSVAVSVAYVAVATWSSAGENRNQLALAETGAAVAYYVRPGPHVHDFRLAVDRADPRGHTMAAAIVRAPRTTPVIGIDASRFAGVGAWDSLQSAEPLGRILSTLGGGAPSVLLTQRAARFEVDAALVPARATASLVVMTTGVDRYDRKLTFALHRGVNQFTRALTCALPCRVTSLLITARPHRGHELPADAQIDASVKASTAPTTARASWRPVRGFDLTSRWRQSGLGVLRFRTTHGGLGITSTPDGDKQGWPSAVSADTPSSLPGVVAENTARYYTPETIHHIATFGLDFAPIDVDGSIRAVNIPTLGRTGVMVDLGLLLRIARGELSPQTQLVVYANAAAPQDMTARLARQGVTVIRVVRAATYDAQLARTGPGYADSLYGFAALIASLLALAASVLNSATTARRRSYEFIAFGTAGVSPRLLRRAIAIEMAALLGTAVIIGSIAGSICAELVLARTPLVVGGQIGPPIDTHVPAGTASVFISAVSAAFLLVGAVANRAVARRATATRLREV